jgi:hypothetical protein
MSIAALVLGIVSFVLSCAFYLSIPAGIVGIVLGILSIRGKKDGKGMAIAGLILAGVGILASIAWIITAALMVNNAGSWYNWLEQYDSYY